MKTLKKIRLLLWVLLCFLLSSGICILLYFYNNKYTNPAPQPRNGFLDLSREVPGDYPLRFLRDGWTFYPDVLLEPEDFADGAPEEYMFYTSIGDSTRFDHTGTRSNPFGCGTWVLDLWLPEKGGYVLELRKYSAHTASM